MYELSVGIAALYYNSMQRGVLCCFSVIYSKLIKEREGQREIIGRVSVIVDWSQFSV